MRTLLFVSLSFVVGISNLYAVSVASSEFVNQRVDLHVLDETNPHSVTAEQVGLGNVKNIDTTNADNITTGTVGVERLPVGTVENTVAAGDDKRFYAVPTSKPSGVAPDGMVFMWFE